MTGKFEFNNRYAILDTNILSKMVDERRAEQYEPVFTFLKKNNVDLLILKATYFEFLGFNPNKGIYDLNKEWIERLTMLPVKDEDLENATYLSALYKHMDVSMNNNQISLVDCLHGAALVKFKEKMVIVTTDLHDYPITIFDLVRTDSITDGRKVVIVGYFTFNKSKYEKAVKSFNKSKTTKM